MTSRARPDSPATSTRATLNNHTAVMVVRRAATHKYRIKVKHGRSLAQGRSGVNGLETGIMELSSVGLS